MFRLAILLLMFVNIVYAKSETVLELYEDIPADLLMMNAHDGKPIPKAERSKRITVKDLKNGHLEVDTSGVEGYESKLVVAFFKRKSKAPLIAYAAEWGDGKILRFLERDDGKWRDVTDTTIPIVEDSVVRRRSLERIKELQAKNINLQDCASGTFKDVLPRQGTTIKAVASAATSDCLKSKSEIVLMEFTFDGDRFNLKP